MNKKLLIAAVGAALAVAGNAYALEAKVSGQVNRAIMFVDDGLQNRAYNVDNATSNTRFRFTGSDDLMPGVKAGIRWEMAFASNASDTVSQTAKAAAPSLTERHSDVYFEGSFGKVSLGQGDGAANSATEVDLSGTDLINYAGNGDVGGGMFYRDTTGAHALTSSTVGGTYTQHDFESRYDRLRYDSPALGPVVLSVSNGIKSDTVNELAAWINQDFGAGGKLAAALGYSKEDLNSAAGYEKTTGGSVSWLAPMGVNVTLATSKKKNDQAGSGQLDSKFQYLKVGYKTGPHAVSVDYGKTEDFVVVGDEAKVKGVGYVYTAQKWAEFYAGYKIHTLDRPGGATVGTGVVAASATFEDIKVLTGGVRLKF